MESTARTSVRIQSHDSLPSISARAIPTGAELIANEVLVESLPCSFHVHDHVRNLVPSVGSVHWACSTFYFQHSRRASVGPGRQEIATTHLPSRLRSFRLHPSTASTSGAEASRCEPMARTSGHLAKRRLTLIHRLRQIERTPTASSARDGCAILLAKLCQAQRHSCDGGLELRESRAEGC